MKSLTTSVQRVTVATGRSFEELEELLLQTLRWFTMDMAESMIGRFAPWEEVKDTVNKIAGRHGLLMFNRAPQGALTSLSGYPKRCTLFLLGNPILANELLRVDLRASLYMPVRVCVYAPDEGATAEFSYETVASLVEALDNPALAPIAREFDTKLEALAKFLVK